MLKARGGYVAEREKLINAALLEANGEVRNKMGEIRGDALNDLWNRVFMTSMDRMAEERGLLPKNWRNFVCMGNSRHGNQ